MALAGRCPRRPRAGTTSSTRVVPARWPKPRAITGRPSLDTLQRVRIGLQRLTDAPVRPAPAECCPGCGGLDVLDVGTTRQTCARCRAAWSAR